MDCYSFVWVLWIIVPFLGFLLGIHHNPRFHESWGGKTLVV